MNDVYHKNNTPSKHIDLPPTKQVYVSGYIVAYFLGSKPSRTYSYNSLADRKQVISIMLKWDDLSHYDIKPKHDVLHALYADEVSKELLLQAIHKTS